MLGLTKRFEAWALEQQDVRTMTNTQSQKRFKEATGERVSTATAGQVMADLRRELRASDATAKSAESFARLTMPAVEVGRNGMHTNIPAPGSAVQPAVPTSQISTVFADMSVVRAAAEKVGGYDRLIELASGLKAAGF